MTIDEARQDISLKTNKGLGMPMAGFLYWVAVSVVVQVYPLKTALIIAFFATGAVFPVGYVLNRWMGGNLINKGHEMNAIGGIFNAMQAFFWPVIIVFFYFLPEWTLFTMVTLFCSHFLGYGWMYQSRGYYVLAIGGPVVAVIAALFLGAGTHTALPPLTAAVYAVACLLVLSETRQMNSNSVTLSG